MSGPTFSASGQQVFRNVVPATVQIGGGIVATHTRDYQISDDKDGYTPLTVKVKGVTYPVFQIQNSSMVAVETGERTPVGQLMFAQLDVQNQFGIYKKYYCLYLGSARCQLRAYVYPDFVIEKDAALPRPADEQYFWLLSSQPPISLVVHPLHLLDFAEREWVVLEINGRRWAFSRSTLP